jgi:hypothetical protein
MKSFHGRDSAIGSHNKSIVSLTLLMQPYRFSHAHQISIGRRLKLHIDDLERKAAVADRLVAGRETLLPDNLMESIDDFTDPQLSAPGTSMAQPIDVPPRVSPNTATSTSRESMASLPRGAAFSGSDW